MSKIKNQMVQPESTSAGEGGVHRRRFVRGVGIIVPAALTITSRSASAAACLSASASASINLAKSRPNRAAGVCNGKSLLYWQNVSSTAPTADFNAFNTTFSSIFFGGPSSTMGVVMNAGNAVRAHLAAAWCNLNTGRVPLDIISLATLQSMWIGRTGTFQPIPGNASVLWGATEIVAFLQTTQTS